MICGYQISNSYGDNSLNLLWHWAVDRRLSDVRTAANLYFSPLLGWKRWNDHAIIDLKMLRHLYLGKIHSQVSWVHQLARDCRGCCDYRAGQVDIGAGSAGPALEIAVAGSN